jgi:hypothetical protein
LSLVVIVFGFVIEIEIVIVIEIDQTVMGVRESYNMCARTRKWSTTNSAHGWSRA